MDYHGYEDRSNSRSQSPSILEQRNIKTVGVTYKGYMETSNQSSCSDRNRSTSRERPPMQLPYDAHNPVVTGVDQFGKP